MSVFRIDRHVVALCLLLAAPLGAQESRARVSLPGWRQPFPIEDIVVDFTIDAPVARTFAATTVVMHELRIPMDVRDSVGGLAGSVKIQPVNRFADRRLSQIFDCGQGSVGPNADSYKLTVVFLALFDAKDATHTKLRIGMVASAKEPVGQNILQCGSTGKLEEYVSDIVRQVISTTKAP